MSKRQDLIEDLIERLKGCVSPDEMRNNQRELDSGRAAAQIKLFLERLNDLEPDWQGVRDHLQNAIIFSKLFDRDEDVQLCINSDPSEYIVTAGYNLSTPWSGAVKTGADTPREALQKMREKMDRGNAHLKNL